MNVKMNDPQPITLGNMLGSIKLKGLKMDRAHPTFQREWKELGFFWWFFWGGEFRG